MHPISFITFFLVLRSLLSSLMLGMSFIASACAGAQRGLPVLHPQLCFPKAAEWVLCYFKTALTARVAGEEACCYAPRGRRKHRLVTPQLRLTVRTSSLTSLLLCIRAATSSLPELYPCPGGPLATATGHSLRAGVRAGELQGPSRPARFSLRDVGTESAGEGIFKCAKNGETCANKTLHLHPTNTGSSIGSNHSADCSPGTGAINESTTNKKEVVVKR